MNTDSAMTASLKPSWNPWPVGLVAFLVSFFCAVVGFGIFATRHHQDLVSPDYYEREIRFQEQIERVARTEALSSEVSVALVPGSGQLELRMPANSTGTIKFYRPANAQLDLQFPLILDAQGRQRLDVSALKPGLWKAHVEWKSGTVEYFKDVPVVIPNR
jgi:nitrogen fixation protein FixH